MKNKLIRRFTATLAAVLCMAAFSVTAYAGGADPDPGPPPETAETPLPEETEESTAEGIEMEPRNIPVTPKGNAALVDDFFRDRQFITITIKAGSYFYILISRANGDKETVVYSLNQVDGADLQALLEDGETRPEYYTCMAKYGTGAVDMNCPVCENSKNVCTGPESRTPKPEEARSQEEKPDDICGLVAFLAVVLASDGVAPCYFRFHKPREDVKDDDDLAEYNFGYDEDDEGETPEPDDAQEPEEGWLIEKETPEQNEEDEE